MSTPPVSRASDAGAEGQCTAHTSRGTPCGMRPLRGRPFCWTHDPERAPDRAAARKLGGHRRKRGTGEDVPESLQLRDLQSVQELLERAVREALAMDTSAERCRLLLSAVDRATQLLKVGEHEQRLAALEQRLAEVAGVTNPQTYPRKVA
ncbi:MAG TPA: hypothetical protein VFS08_10460 [Gemmatimonadaceae bacterium]|nr:hypothetical protein [Gemmatimonadaceae bacterium]